MTMEAVTGMILGFFAGYGLMAMLRDFGILWMLWRD